MRVADVMTTDVLTVRPETEIRRVVHLLIERDVSGAVVVGDNDEVVGIVTERDCIRVVIEAGYFDHWGGPVERFMSTPVESISPEDSVIDIAAKMATSPYRRFPVVADNRLVGLLSRRDVLRAINRH